MMRVVKVLNNSVVLVLTKDGDEAILMGKGIGFGKSSGDSLDEQETEKIFALKDRNLARNIARLAAEIDPVIFEITKDVIDYAKNRYHMNLMDHIYLALTDHLAFAVKRVEEDLDVPGFYAVEIRRYNPNEYEVGRYTLRLLKERLGVELPTGECSNIAFHFINAQRDNPNNSNNRQMAEMVKGILDIVKYTFGLIYQEDTIAYSRFVTHLQAFAQRTVLGQQLPYEDMDFLYQEVIKQCQKEFACVQRIAHYMKERYQTEITLQEECYLTLHIHRVLEEHQGSATKTPPPPEKA